MTRRSVSSLLALAFSIGVSACSSSNASPNDPAILTCMALEQGMRPGMGSPDLVSHRIEGSTAHIIVTYSDPVGVTETRERDCLFAYSEDDGGFFLTQTEFVPQIDMEAPLELDAMSTEEKQRTLYGLNQEKERLNEYLEEMLVMLNLMNTTRGYIPVDQTQLRLYVDCHRDLTL